MPASIRSSVSPGGGVSISFVQELISKRKQREERTFSNGNLFFPMEARVSLCDPTSTKPLVRTAFGPPGLAITENKYTK